MDNEDPNSPAKPFEITLRKLDLGFIPGDEIFTVSKKEDFDAALGMAHSYVENSKPLPTQDALLQIGIKIGEDFQFLDQGGGCNTISGQLKKPSIENRDCKLPTFILGLAWAELNPAANAEIIYLKSNIAHPYIRLESGGEVQFGHFTKPNPKENINKSEFQLLDETKKSQLENFRIEGRTSKFPLSLQGMQDMDELFITF